LSSAPRSPGDARRSDVGKDRHALPQPGGRLFLTDGGLETTLIFHEGLDLPHFAAFHLLRTREGTAALRKYFTEYAELAKRFGTGLILESPTWRASLDWGARLDYTADALAEANRSAIRLLEEIRGAYDTERAPVLVSGCLGPRGDGYVPDQVMSAEDAEHYHQQQIDTLAGTTADMVCALTLNYAAEAVGIARAARRAVMPVAISFTVETNGTLATGQPLLEAIDQVDAATERYPSYYMINCAHPTHFASIRQEGARVERILGLRANASRLSHAELNEATDLDAGNPVEIGREYAELKTRLRHLGVLGGCCGTDGRHIEQIARACLPLFRHAP